MKRFTLALISTEGTNASLAYAADEPVSTRHSDNLRYLERIGREFEGGPLSSRTFSILDNEDEFYIYQYGSCPLLPEDLKELRNYHKTNRKAG